MALKFTMQAICAVLFILISFITINTIRFGKATNTSVKSVVAAKIDITASARRLADLVQIKTISVSPKSPVAENAFFEMHDTIAKSFPLAHAKMEREILGDFSLLYRWPGSRPDLKPILFIAHMDVVPVEQSTLSQWSHDPFSGSIDDGFIWGRGTLDMKASLAGILEAVENLVGQGFEPTRTLYLAFSHDEELGGTHGTASIVKALKNRGVKLLFTLDEGMPISMGLVPGVSGPVALIGLAEKGRVTLELTAHDKGGHSSMPPSKTAVGKLSRALNQLTANQFPARLQSPTTEMFANLAPIMSLDYRIALANTWISQAMIISQLEKTPAGNATVRTTTAPTIIQGGLKPNILPTISRAVVDFRILLGDTVASVRRHVIDTIDDTDISVRIVGNKPSDPTMVSDRSSASYLMLKRSILQVFPNVTVAPGLVIGRTDSHHYSEIAENSFRFLPMRLGPDDLKRMHGIDERIAISNYAEFIQFYIHLISNSIGGRLHNEKRIEAMESTIKYKM